MEQVNTTTEIIPFSQVAADLPGIYTANKGLADRAVSKVSDYLNLQGLVEAVQDFSKIPIGELEGVDQSLNGLQVKLSDAYKLMNDRRSPLTKKLNEVVSKFTAEEKKITDISDRVKHLRNSIQAEKAVRIRKEQELQQLNLHKKQAEVEVKKYQHTYIMDKYAELLVQKIHKLHETFNSKTIQELDAYGVQLGQWHPMLSVEVFNSFCPISINPKPQFFTTAEVDEFLLDVAAEKKPLLSAEWFDRFTEEKTKLIEIIPSRKRELEAIASDINAKIAADERIQKEKEELDQQIQQQASEAKQEIEQRSEVDKMNTVFDNAAEAKPALAISKGTVVKRKYKPTSHKGHIAILQYWVTNCMPLMTLEDLKTKLSFMRTAADKDLNGGKPELVSEGLEIEEDYSARSVRGSKKENEAA